MIWRCAVPSPLRRHFDYRPPADWQGTVKPGVRVSVPFGKRAVTAVVVSAATESEIDETKLRHVTALLDTAPLYTEAQLALLRWAADYYQHPAGEVLPLGLSPGERRGKTERTVGEPGLSLTTRGQGLPEGAPHRAPKQAALVFKLKQGPASLQALAAEGFSRTVIKALIDHDLATSCELKR